MRKFKVIDESGHGFALGAEVIHIGRSKYGDCVLVEGVDRDTGITIPQDVRIGSEVVEIFQG